ncbi:MAG TPA: serine/threonine-protein kinase [Kofleriaceae bacterium]|nr:serine/threonine-protein kinase [Kofleriaceae bacterium]
MRQGVRIGGYRLLRQIGEGGMGVVWMGAHSVLGRRAAIKVLRPEYSMRHDIVTRFFNEARAATAISDPGIVQIFDVGHHTDGSAYIVMELLDGESLDSRLKRSGVIPVGSALRMCRQIASSVGAAHARGIIHRDLKPENIFIVRDPEVAGGERAKILDFGIAKLAGDVGTRLQTQASAIIGTPPYMSPEQCRGGGEVDRRSDIYSLGCVLFALVTGHPPFRAKAPGVLLMQHMTDPPPQPSACAPDLPAEIDGLILRCLAKDPDERFDSGLELALAIDPLVALPAIANATPPPPPMPPRADDDEPVLASTTTLGPSDSFAPPAPMATRSRSRRRLYAKVAVAAAVAGGAVTAVVAALAGPDASQAAAAPATGAARPISSGDEPARPSNPRLARAADDMRALLAAFPAWAHDHAGAPCPTSAELGGHGDPWGHDYDVTCADQPADQIVGVRSAGPDGEIGTDDDLTSWTMGLEVVRRVRGKRWAPAPASPPARPREPTPVAGPRPSPPPHRRATPSRSKPSEDPGIIDLDGDGIPDSR